LPPLVAHQAHCALVNHLVQNHQVVVFQLAVRPVEVVIQELEQLVMLLSQVGEVDEKSAAHVALHGLDRLRPGGSVVLHQKVAVLQQAAAPDFFRVSRCDEFPVKMVEGLTKVAIDAFPHHCRIEVFADVHAGAVVEEEECVEHDVEGVDRELELPLHPVHELQLDAVRLVVPQRDQTPSVTIVHFHHLGHVGLFQSARRHPLL